MAVNSGYRYKILASIVAVVGVLLLIALYQYPDSPATRVSELEAEHSSEQGKPLDQSPSSVLLSNRSGSDDDHARSRQEVQEHKTRLAIDVNSGLVLVDAVEATLRDVLGGLIDKSLVEVVDLRPEGESVAEEFRSEKQTFRFSGSVDDVLRSVMGQYNYSYAISNAPATGTQAPTPLTKLFLYGTMQGEDTQLADDQRLSPDSAEAVPATGYVESEGGPGIDPERIEKKQVNISEVLRNRALSTANPSASSAGSNTSQQPGLSGDSSSTGSTPASDSLDDDEAMRSRLADMTRRASEEVRALAEGLKEAEQNLETQRNNEYGEAAQ